MRDMITMVVVLSVMSLSSAGILAFLNNTYKKDIEINELDFVKGPAIKTIFEGASNNPLTDRFKIKDGDVERIFFVGKFNGKPEAVAFETIVNGFADKVGVMVGINIENDKILHLAVTTSKETKGLGAKAKDDPSFAAQFKDLAIFDPFKVSSDGGQINAISGATITSRAVCKAATDVGTTYKQLKPQIKENLNEFAQ
ncbi:MAG: FMN-binding protein [Desulfobacterales bacterium]|nr:FMN-binding protein [Desulfobacterales bacterium]